MYDCVILKRTVAKVDQYLDRRQNYAGVKGMKVLIGRTRIFSYCMSASIVLIIINVHVRNGSFNQIEIDIVPTAYLLVNYNRAGSTEHIFYTIFTRFVCSPSLSSDQRPGIPI